MKVVSTEQMREIEKKTISDFEISGETLMDRAGAGVASAVQYLARLSGLEDAPVHLFAGRGNNGGDAFAAARYLKERNFSVEVWLASEANAVSGDALRHLSKMKSAGITMHELPTKQDWDDALETCGGIGGIIVDGILGTGISGPVRGPAAGAIRFINALSGRNPVVAIDVPSGLNADTGKVEGTAVSADITVTMGLPKTGLAQPCAIEYIGAVEVADIGIPNELLSRVQSEIEMITAGDLGEILARRPRGSHKGSFGHALIVSGAAGYAGAVALAASAAIRSGAGLVTALVPARIAPVVAGIVPEAMVHPASETEAGSLASDCLRKWNRSINDFDALLIGPGMTACEETGRLVESILVECRKPVVADADALNVCAGRTDLLKRAACPLVVTPHPGEMARLAGRTAAQVQANRFGTAMSVAGETGAVVVLKGAGTIVAAKKRPMNINLTGNPGMAKGGMGDVLGGLVSGLLAQGIEPFDAARLGVYIHGRAGDNAAWHLSQAGMTAGDVIDELPGIFREIAAR